jgi:PAS domain S-box-containing protein/putative nucleotidyltransferase with HDIG domain
MQKTGTSQEEYSPARSLPSGELYKAEESLLMSETRYRLLAENAADLIWTVDIRTPQRPTFISSSVTRLTGYSAEEAMANRMDKIFAPSSLGKIGRALVEIEQGIPTSGYHSSVTLDVELIHKNGSKVPAEVKLSFLPGPDGRLAEILAVARDITERRRAEEAAKKSTERLVKAMEDTLLAMARIVELRDPYTAGHQRRVAMLACAIAEDRGLSSDMITGLRLAGLIHDVGKIRVPAEILTNPDGLSHAEFDIVKTHPSMGYEILKPLDLPWPVADIVRQHHERLDGSGYPDGLTGQSIIAEAKILSVADVVEAIASHRPYRPAYGLYIALEEITLNRGILYDAAAVNSCLKLFKEKGFRFPSEVKDPSIYRHK